MRFALKCLGSGTLEKRLNGLMDINDLLESANERENPRRFMRENQIKPTKWLTLGYMVDWLLEHKIVDQIFGIHCHPELVKRSGNTLMLFAKHDKIDPHILDLLWNSSIVMSVAIFL